MAFYNYCRRYCRRYIINFSKSTRCFKYVYYKLLLYNYILKLSFIGDWSSLDRQRRKLRLEIDEAIAKVLRLSRQQQLLEDWEKEIIYCGCETLDKLDAAEAIERAAFKVQESRSLALAKAFDFLNNPFLDFEALSGLLVSFWENLAYFSPLIGVSLELGFSWGAAPNVFP